MSAAVLSLIEIIFVATSSTVYVAPGAANPNAPDSGELPRLFTESGTVSSWSHETLPAAICRANAPRTNSLNCDPIGPAFDAAISCTGSHVPSFVTRAARKPTFGPSSESRRSIPAQSAFVAADVVVVDALPDDDDEPLHPASASPIAMTAATRRTGLRVMALCYPTSRGTCRT